MGTQVYRSKTTGEVIPSVTTVISASLGWNKGALMYWAWNQGKQGKDFKKSTQDAADAGTLAHLWSEQYDKGMTTTDPPPGMSDEMIMKAVGGLEAYKRWRDRNEVRFIGIETPLVSEKHQFGGTIDRIAKVGKDRAILDIKTSKSTYADHLVQVAAYGVLVLENGVMETVDTYEIVRFGREGDFHHASYPKDAMTPAWEAFQHLHALYGLKKKLENLT